MESVNLISRCAIRAETVHLWTKFGSFGLSLNEEQIPQIVKNNKNQGGRETSWKDFFCAQGRCATRLRYAPTPSDYKSLAYRRRVRPLHQPSLWEHPARRIPRHPPLAHAIIFPRTSWPVHA